jgi:hypothetical protein
MKTLKFHDKRGFCTRYAHACGYLDSASLNGDAQHVTMGFEGACYFVKCRTSATCPVFQWETFDAWERKKARAVFMAMVKREGATRRIGRDA